MNKKIGLKLLSVLITSAIVFMSFSATVFADENDIADADVQIESEEEQDEIIADIEAEPVDSDSDETEGVIDEPIEEVSETTSDETEDIAEAEESTVIDETILEEDAQEEQDETNEESEEEEHPDTTFEYYGETSIIPYEDDYSLSVSANYGTVSYGSGMYQKQFSAVDEATYEILSYKISLVADGQLPDTEFLINLSDIGFDNVFTAEELGIEYIYKDGASYPNLGNIIFNQIICDWSPMLHRLLVENPYELYWFDKTSRTGIRMSTPEMGLKWDDSLQQYVATYDGGLIYYFPICEAYADETAESDFIVDFSQIQRAKNAASYAQKIVAQNADLSDIEKLNKYMEVICNLVDYNTAAASDSTTPYGDPWNLVYVFDRDPDTKVVCEGYSKAFKYLCDLSSFENSDLTCILASGYFQSSNTYGPHMWNIVSFGEGLNYMVDVTNCDYGTIGAPNYLFLRNVDSGSASNTYTYTLYIYGRTNNLYYTYKTETLDLYNIEPLTINTSPLFDAPEVILSATCSGIELQWLKEHTAYSYDIYRRTSNSMWSLVTNTTNNSYTDTTVSANMQYYYCIVCKNANGEKMNQFDDQYTITAVTHSIVVDQAVPVTCTTDGLTEGSHCSTCGKIIVAQQVIEAKGHTVVVDPGIDATCEHVGLTEGSHCSVCNKVLVAQEIIPTLEHEVVTVPGKPATGTEDGYTDYQYCSICGLVLKPRTIIPATGQSNENEDDPYVEPYDKNKYDFDVSTSYNGKNLTIKGVLKNPEIANNIAGVNVYYRKPDMDDYIYFTQVSVYNDSFTLDRYGLTEGIEYSFIFEFYFKDGYITFHEKHIDVIFGNQDEPYIFAIVNQPSDYTGSVGKVATFSVKAQGTDLKYQWQVYKNGSWSDSSLPGAKTNTISIDITAARNGYKFRCNVSDVNGHVKTSREATLYVKSVLSVIEQPNDYFGFVGEHATFYVVAKGEGLSYQWQVNKNGTWINSSLPGAKSDSLHFDITAARNGYKFRCVIKDTKGNTVTSDFATLVVYQSFAITKNPENCSGPVNGTALFKVIASGDDLKYQWQVNSNGTWRDSSMPGAKTDTLSVSITTARNGYKFRCVVKTANGAESITSNEATLTVVQSLTITSDPANYTGVAGGKAVFTVTADGIGLKYQWQVNKNGTWADSSMTGCKTDTLTVDITSARNGYKFRCVIRDAVGNTVTSKDATLSVAQAITITAQPLNYTGPAGDTAIFKVAAEGEGLTYQWQVNKNGTWANSSMTGCKTNTLSVNITDARDGYKFRCVIKNASGITVTTEEVTLFVGNPYFVVD